MSPGGALRASSGEVRYSASMRRGAIIVCGGRSKRMGRDKATLPFGQDVLLQRIVRTLGQSIAPA
ncbi:MAG: NTP transferase domain-containing protein, partial [Planctomycetaceae bacterium]